MSTKLNLFLTIFLILALLLRFLHFFSSQPKYSKNKEGQRLNFVAVLTSQPQFYSQTQRFKVQGVKVVTTSYPEYSYGDRLKISGTLKNGVLIFPKIEVVEKSKGNFILRKFFALRKRLINLFGSFLPEPAASLLLGIFLGVKKGLPREFYLNLRKTGVLHVVVASGMNVTMVAAFALALFNLIFKREKAIVLAFLGVLFYTVLSGFDPPIIRAAIMGTILLLSQFLGRLNWGVLSLLTAGYLMVFLNPNLVSDLGFQLSFLSTAGLLFIKPLFRLQRGHLLILKDDLVTTFSAQVATLPIILANFGRYQLLSLLVNTLVLWTTPILMGFGGGVAILGLVFPPLGQLLAFLSFPFLFYFEKTVAVFSHLSFIEISVGRWPPFLILGYYFLLTALLILGYKRRWLQNLAHDRGQNFEAKLRNFKRK